MVDNNSNNNSNTTSPLRNNELIVVVGFVIVTLTYSLTYYWCSCKQNDKLYVRKRIKGYSSG